jgi:tetratricopeptide (TPR) repeat protein
LLSYDNVADVLVAQAMLDEALAMYRASLEIAARLAASDRSNAGWQRDLAVSHNRVGDVQVPQSELDEVLGSYRAALEISERLVTLDPSNAGWQDDLAATNDKIGNALWMQGKLDRALASYRAALGHAWHAMGHIEQIRFKPSSRFLDEIWRGQTPRVQ